MRYIENITQPHPQGVQAPQTSHFQLNINECSLLLSPDMKAQTSLDKKIIRKEILSTVPLLLTMEWIYCEMTDNGNRTEWSAIPSVITWLINKPSRSPIYLIASMITDQIGPYSVLSPVNYNHYNFRENKSNTILFHRLVLQIRPFWKIPSLVG